MFLCENPNIESEARDHAGRIWATRLLEQPSFLSNATSDYSPNSLELSLFGETTRSSGQLTVGLFNGDDALHVKIDTYSKCEAEPIGLRHGFDFEIPTGDGITPLLPSPISSRLLATAELRDSGDPHIQAIMDSELTGQSKTGMLNAAHRFLLPGSELIQDYPEFSSMYEFFYSLIDVAIHTATNLFIEKWSKEGRSFSWHTMPRKYLDTIIHASVAPYLTHLLQETTIGNAQVSKQIYRGINHPNDAVDPNNFFTVYEVLAQEYISNLSQMGSQNFRYFAYLRSLTSQAGRSRALGQKELEYLERTGRLTQEDTIEAIHESLDISSPLQTYSIPHNFNPAILLAMADSLLLHQYSTVHNSNLGSEEIVDSVVQRVLGFMGFVGDVQNSLLSGRDLSRVAYSHSTLQREFHDDLVEYIIQLRGK